MSANSNYLPITNHSQETLHILLEPQGQVLSVKPGSHCRIYIEPELDPAGVAIFGDQNSFEISYCENNWLKIYHSNYTLLFLDEEQIE